MMLLPRLISFLTGFALLGSSALATITLQFTQASSGWIASNFANAAGTPTNGMSWGVLIDTTGNGFSINSYSAFTVTTDGFLSAGGTLTDDYYFHSPNPTVDTSGATESGGTVTGAPGSVTILASVPFAGTTGITQGDSFGLIWFSTNSAATGAKYGFLTRPTPQGSAPAFQIPSDGSTTNYSEQFSGVDPIRSATNTIAAVPEPAVSFLAGTGLLFFATRRRPRR